VIRFLVFTLAVATACTPGAEAPAGPTTRPAPATSSTGDTVAPEWDTSSPFAGFSLSPQGFEESGFVEFLETASAAGDLVAWVGPWQEIDRGGTLVYDLSVEHGYVPVVVTGFPTDAAGRRVVPDDAAELVDAIADWVADHPVPYLGVGVEINSFLWEKSPEDLEWFVTAFPQVVAAVHEVSPDTKVFPGFQLERLRGLKSGLYGEQDTDPEWELIDLFPDADVIGFTTYPGLIFNSPNEIPDDYYIEILQHTDKPIVFTEVGWQAGGELGDWSGTPEDQADFVATRVGELAVLSDMLIWSFLWDQEAAPEPFATMGLIDRSGQTRPAFDLWRNLLG
jgi:hypothetical protein